MAPRKQSRGASSKSAATTPVPKKRVATNGFKLPDPIPAGQVITDIAKNVWVLGKSIGQGGFGEIYLASADPTRPVCDTDKYVVKVEPHSNGPLFTEMHCYMRIAKPDLIEAWMKEHKYKRFGMPKYLGSGSFVYMSQKYRFMVMERFGSDLQKILEQHNKKFSFKTVYQVGLEIIDVLEYIHDKGYIHADIKASNLLVGFQRGTQDQVFLVDYGLACRYAVDGVHKEYKYDGRKAHDGTIEFTSRDAHIGAHSRRGDLEILGYNLCQWLCSRLPWEDNLTDCDLVAKHKRYYMDNVDKLMDKCFPDDAPIPPGLQEFLTYVASLTFDEKPDYEKCRNILRDGLVERDYKDDGKLVFMSATPKPISKKPKSRIKVSETESDNSFASPATSLFGKRKRKQTTTTTPKRKMLAKSSTSSDSSDSNIIKSNGRRRDSIDMFGSEGEEVHVLISDTEEADTTTELEVIPVPKTRGTPRGRGLVTTPASGNRKRVVATKDAVAKKNKKLSVMSNDVFEEDCDESIDVVDSSHVDDMEKENIGELLNPVTSGRRATPKRKPALKTTVTPRSAASQSPMIIAKSPSITGRKKTIASSSVKSPLSKKTTKSPIVKAKVTKSSPKARRTAKVAAQKTVQANASSPDLFGGIENPTPAMLEIMAKRKEKEANAAAGKRKRAK